MPDYPAIKYLRENEVKCPWRHFGAVSELSSNLLKHVAIVLVVLLVVALSKIESTFTWENLVVLLLTLGQAFFIEYLVHWRWNLFDLSFDSVVKFFGKYTVRSDFLTLLLHASHHLDMSYKHLVSFLRHRWPSYSRASCLRWQDLFS